MTREDAVAIAEIDFKAAENVLRKCAPGKPGFNAEAKYGEAYRRLMNLGARPKLRLKYQG